MTNITISNADSGMIDNLKTAIQNAALSGTAIFDNVDIVGSVEEAEQKLCKDAGPNAAVVYQGTTEYMIPDLEKGVDISAVIFLAAKKNTDTLRKTEIARLKNAVINAIENTPPTGAQAFGVDEELHEAVSFGAPEIDAQNNLPWVICSLPITVGYIITSETTH